MQYMLLIHGDETAMQHARKEDIGAMMAAYGAYTQAMQEAGVLRAGERLLYVDTSGVYFDGDASPTFSTDYVSFANAGTTSTLFTTMTNGTSSAAGLLTVGGTAYFVNSVEGSNDFTANLYKSTGGAMGTMVAMYPGVDPIAFIGDANGAFLFGSSSGTRPGVYKVDLGSGTATMWGTGQPKQGAALDAKNVYFIDSASDLVALTR